MAKRIVTVDIDDSAIRLLQVRGNQVERWATASLEPMGGEDGATADPRALAAQLRRLKRSSGITGREVVASVSGLFSVTRTLNILAAAQLGLGQSIAEQAQAALPTEDLRLHWQTLRADTTGQHLLVVGANEQQIAAQMGVLSAAGMSPKVLEFKSIALARLADRPDAIIVNVEPTSLDLVLIVNGLPQVMRTATLPGTPSAEERANHVLQAVEHTVAYYESQHDGSSLPSETPLYLVGPMAQDPSLRQQIEKRGEYPLESLAPLLEFPPHLPVAEYAVNMGLALREAQTGSGQQQGVENGMAPIRINLAPHVRRWPLNRRQTGFAVAAVAGLALAYFLFQLGTAASQVADELQGQVRAIDQRVSVRRLELNRLTQLEAAIGDFEKLAEPRGHVTEMVELLQDTVTPGVEIKSITVEPTNVGLSASAETVAEMIDFVEALRATGRFVAVPYSRTTTAFSATLNLAQLQAK